MCVSVRICAYLCAYIVRTPCVLGAHLEPNGPDRLFLMLEFRVAAMQWLQALAREIARDTANHIMIWMQSRELDMVGVLAVGYVLERHLLS